MLIYRMGHRFPSLMLWLTRSHGLRICVNAQRREDEAASKLASEFGFKRRVMVETGSAMPCLVQGTQSKRQRVAPLNYRHCLPDARSQWTQPSGQTLHQHLLPHARVTLTQNHALCHPADQNKRALGANSRPSAPARIGPMPKLVSPSKVESGVFVGRFSSRLGPYQKAGYKAGSAAGTSAATVAAPAKGGKGGRGGGNSKVRRCVVVLQRSACV